MDKTQRGWVGWLCWLLVFALVEALAMVALAQEIIVSSKVGPPGSGAGWALETTPAPPYNTAPQPKIGFVFTAGPVSGAKVSAVDAWLVSVRPAGGQAEELTLQAALYVAEDSVVQGQTALWFPGVADGPDRTQDPAPAALFEPVKFRASTVSKVMFTLAAPVDLDLGVHYAFVVWVAAPQPTKTGLMWANIWHAVPTEGDGVIEPYLLVQYLAKAGDQWKPYWAAEKSNVPKDARRFWAVVR